MGIFCWAISLSFLLSWVATSFTTPSDVDVSELHTFMIIVAALLLGPCYWVLS